MSKVIDLLRRESLKQTTIRKEVSFSGIGLFSGRETNVTLLPAEEGTGIIFERVDLPLSPLFSADLEHVKGTERSTLLGDERVDILMVEHLLAAIQGCGVDNLHIKVDGFEIPVTDGSSLIFAKLIQEAKVVDQQQEKKTFSLPFPIYLSKKEHHIIALPYEKGLKISYTLQYPTHAILRSQYFSYEVEENNFIEELAPARTFALYEEIEPLIKNGVLKGAGLDHGLLIRDGEVVNPEGMRFPDEMARHKVLDILGDFSLLQCNLSAHIIAIRSGHEANISLAKKVQSLIRMREK